MAPFFYIVATVYLLVAGKPVDTNGEKNYFQHKFETLDDCKAYLASDEAFGPHREELTTMYKAKVADDHVQIAITAECAEYKPKPKDDGSI